MMRRTMVQSRHSGFAEASSKSGLQSAFARPGVAIALAAAVFLVDTLSSLHFGVASLYVAVILIGAYQLESSGIILAGVSCAALTTVSYVLTHGFALSGAAPL